jgi:2',3'-cyclic-nucleotide 2'-phosphodiesterase / 3'-nucleotidase / 5'-nucleotidase
MLCIMKKILLTIGLIGLYMSSALAQVQVSVTVPASNDTDDAEEVLFGGTETAGTIDLGSSDLELGFETSLSQDPQLVGIRFRNIELPKGTKILSAYIQFTVDENDKNNNPFEQFIYIENNVNSAPFAATAFNLSSRNMVNDSVLWTGAGDWLTIGESGANQRTSDLTVLVDSLINRADWEEGKTLAFFLKGSGRRVAESSADAVGNPKLVITYEAENVVYKPELLKSIPDQILKQGWNLNLDIKKYFQDKDSPLSFEVKNLQGNDISPEFSFENGVLSGGLDYPTLISFEVFAISQGDTISDVFQVAFEANTTPILKQVGSIKLGKETAAEISAYDPSSKRLFTCNAEKSRIDISDFSNPATIMLIDSILLPEFAGGVNSLSFKNGMLAAALEDTVKQDSGKVYVYDFEGNELWNVTVGALPDMLTFNNNGSKIIVANEGEPNADYSNDPVGSISVIDVATQNVTTLDFSAYNGQEAMLGLSGIRIFGLNATVAQDIEPEYITVSGDSAFVTCQENNAIAIVNLQTLQIADLIGLGTKNHNLVGNGIDLPRAKGALIDTIPVKGFYMPDAIAHYSHNGQTYLVTANEGDSRVYTGFNEEKALGDVKLDASIFTNTSFVELASNLKITKFPADTNASGEYKSLYTFGSRSFSIWNASTGEQVFDSKDDFERISGSMYPSLFNASNNNKTAKNRSDDKGPEPEAITIGEVDGKTYAFIGLERVGGVIVYDISNPIEPIFIDYLNNRLDANNGDSGPEGIMFISADESPNNVPLVVVSNEISGTVTAYSVGEAMPNFTLAVFHNNDGESDLLPDSITVNGVKTTGGSISQFKNTLDSMRVDASAKALPSIMLSSGDNFLAGLEYNASQANGVFYDALALDSLDYDAIALGNHDFDFGTQVLADFISSFGVNKAPYLSSNLSYENVPELKSLQEDGRIASSTVVLKDGEQIGVIGLTTPLLPVISSPGNTMVSEAIIDSVQAQVQQLTALGVNKIILISHLQDLNEEIMLTSKISGVDIIIAGGGDELLSNDPQKGMPFNLGEPVGKYPMVTKDKDSNNVYLVTTPGNYRYLGNLVVDFDPYGKVKRVFQNSDLVLVTGKSNEALKQQVEEPIQEYIGNLSTNVIAIFEDTVDFRREKLRKEETNGGNLFADALLWQAQETFATFGVNKPQVAIQNAGGLRIEQLILPGNFTEDKTYQTAAFTNIVCVVEDIDPEHFLALIEHGIAKTPNLDGRFPQIAGFTIEYDPTKAAGSRVINITLNDGTKIVEGGVVEENAPLINLATIDFTAKGGDAYPFDTLQYKTIGATYQQAFKNYLVDGLNGLVTDEDYNYMMNERIIKTTPVGVNSSETTTAITAFPNPSDMTVNFSQAIEAEIYNDLGVLVATLDQATHFDVSTYENGLYLIKIKGGQTIKLSVLK